MRVDANVIRVEQRIDVESLETMSYLIVELLGLEVPIEVSQEEAEDFLIKVEAEKKAAALQQRDKPQEVPAPTPPENGRLKAMVAALKKSGRGSSTTPPPPPIGEVYESTPESPEETPERVEFGDESEDMLAKMRERALQRPEPVAEPEEDVLPLSEGRDPEAQEQEEVTAQSSEEEPPQVQAMNPSSNRRPFAGFPDEDGFPQG